MGAPSFNAPEPRANRAVTSSVAIREFPPRRAPHAGCWLLLSACASLAGSPREAGAQQPTAWNDLRSLELVGQARARRSVPRSDSGLTSYRARATGYVYFYLDRGDSGERNLVKTDQLALDIFWATPNRTKQHIVGMRDASSLPNNIRYHMDHLTVVQDEYGDIIRLGDGDEVRDVPHPAAPGSDARYDFRLSDSLSIRLSGRPEPIRVYEIQVRPKRFDDAAFVGSMFIDRESAAIVRMSFTFTPASYVDPRLDYIRISLDNGLWDGRYWLPHEQRLEIRRQVPEIDFPTGGVIRGVLRIGEYRFNEELPEIFFAGRPVVAFPEAARERFPFDQDLDAELEVEGLEAPAELEELRRTALELVGAHRLSGLPGVRLRLENASSLLRYNRAEGVRVGLGVVWMPTAAARLSVDAGYPFARARPSGGVALEAPVSERLSGRLELFHERMRDMRPASGVSGAMNTLHASLAEIDHLDPFFASGAELRLSGPVGSRWRLAGSVLVEKQRTATLAISDGDTAPTVADDSAEGADGFRPVRRIPAGTVGEVSLEGMRLPTAGASSSWGGNFSLTLGTWRGELYLQPEVELEAQRSASGAAEPRMELSTAFGLALGSAAPQRLYLIGGAGTIPGFAYRSFGGDRFWRGGAEASIGVAGKWLRPRILAYAGWTAEGGEALPAGWGTRPSGGLKASLGGGLGIFHDILRIDVARGFGGGEWQTLVSVRPRLRDFL